MKKILKQALDFFRFLKKSKTNIDLIISNSYKREFFVRSRYGFYGAYRDRGLIFVPDYKGSPPESILINYRECVVLVELDKRLSFLYSEIDGMQYLFSLHPIYLVVLRRRARFVNFDAVIDEKLYESVRPLRVRIDIDIEGLLRYKAVNFTENRNFN